MVSNQFKTLSIKLTESIMTISMARPKVNAMSVELLNDLDRAFSEASAKKDVKGVLLCSDLKSTFSAGLDLANLFELCSKKDRSTVEDFFFRRLNRGLCSPLNCSKPVACSVNGHAIAGGMILALACDYIGVGTNKQTLVGLTEIKVGVPFPVVPLKIADRSLNPLFARKLIFDANLISLTEAFQQGFGNEMSDNPDEQAMKWLKMMAERPLDGFKITKMKWWANVRTSETTQEEKNELFTAITNDDCLNAMKKALVKKIVYLYFFILLIIFYM